jgi:hypothetical protein
MFDYEVGMLMISTLDADEDLARFSWVWGAGWEGFVHYDTIREAEQHGYVVRREFGTYRVVERANATIYVFLIVGDKLQLISCILMETLNEPTHSVTFNIPVLTKWERGKFGEVFVGWDVPASEIYYGIDHRDVVQESRVEAAIDCAESQLEHQNGLKYP